MPYFKIWHISATSFYSLRNFQSKSLFRTSIGYQIKISKSLSVYKMKSTTPQKRIVSIFLFLLIINIIGFSQIPIVHGHSLEQRLVLINNNFVLTDRLPALKNILRRAASQGFTGVVISDVKFGMLSDFPEGSQYRKNLNDFLDEAIHLELEVYPSVVNFGYAGALLSHDPNLAEALPVKEVPFIVKKSANGLMLMNDPSDLLEINNANFENLALANNKIDGWSHQDKPGVVTFVDTKESQSGTQSIKVTNLDKADDGKGRISQYVSVEPFRDYYASVWIKTKNWEKGLVQLLAIDTDSQRELQHNPIKVTNNQEWTQYELTFNTLNSEKIQIFLGVWQGGKGTIWFDNLQIKPTTFNNIIRRETTPVQLKKSNGQVLREGIDTSPITDPLSGYDPYPGSFSIWHTQPQISIPPSSTLKEGDKVLVSYFHAGIVNGFQTGASLTEPAALDLAAKQMKEVQEIWQAKKLFKGWFLDQNEIRINNWDNSPTYGSPGANLAYNTQELYKRAKRIDPNGALMIWSDMFDLYHHANKEVNPFYLVNGSWEESWNGLKSDITIFNWQYWDRVNSGTFFAQKGSQQILCGFYDQPTFYTKTWLKELEGTKGIKGVMYATWENDYSQLENWAEEIWGGRATTSGTVVNNKELSLILHPNPANDYLKAELKGSLLISRIILMDTTGKIVIDQKSPSSKSVRISTKHLGSGIYIVIAHTNDEQTSVFKKVTIH